MKTKEFDEMLKRRIEEMKRVLPSKAVEYASEDNRLEDFETISRISGLSVGDVWKVLQAKHLASIYKMLDGKLEITQAMIDEKVGDSTNYHPLVEAILTDMLKKNDAILRAILALGEVRQ